MSITVECRCGKKLKARDEDAGKKAKCPGCGSLVVIEELPVLVEVERPLPIGAVTLDIGSLNSPGGFFACRLRISEFGEAKVTAYSSDEDNPDGVVILMNLHEFGEFLDIILNAAETIERLRASGQIRG